jgi:hypothetical protein
MRRSQATLAEQLIPLLEAKCLRGEVEEVFLRKQISKARCFDYLYTDLQRLFDADSSSSSESYSSSSSSSSYEESESESESEEEEVPVKRKAYDLLSSKGNLKKMKM